MAPTSRAQGLRRLAAVKPFHPRDFPSRAKSAALAFQEGPLTSSVGPERKARAALAPAIVSIVSKGDAVFYHVKNLQYNAKPERPDPFFARRLQEVLGGQWGEMTVAITYLFQGWNCRGPAKYRDMIMDVATEELAHVEMLATMIARLLEGAPIALKDAAVAQHPAVAAVMGGMDPQHAIVTGLGASPNDSNGIPFMARYTVASGNLLADFRYNVAAESQGRLQVARLFNMTEDKGVRDMLSFNMARDTMHQNQWLAAIEELKADGLEETPCPSSFPQEANEHTQFSYQFWDLSQGNDSKQGRWAQGPTPDGKGQFEYLEKPAPATQDAPIGPPAAPRVHGTPATPPGGREREAVTPHRLPPRTRPEVISQFRAGFDIFRKPQGGTCERSQTQTFVE